MPESERQSWTWVDSRTRRRASITSCFNQEQAERQLGHWRERDAKGGRPDLHDKMPYIVAVRVPESHFGSRPGDIIPEYVSG